MFSVHHNVFAELKAPSFMPSARLIARYRECGQILAFETKSEPFNGGVCIITDVPTLEIASGIDIGWFAEGCFLPLVADDKVSAA